MTMNKQLINNDLRQFDGITALKNRSKFTEKQLQWRPCCRLRQKKSLSQVLSYQFFKNLQSKFSAEYPWMTGCYTATCIFQKQLSQAFYKKSVLKNVAIYIGKHVCWSLFLIKLQPLRTYLFFAHFLLFLDNTVHEESQ